MEADRVHSYLKIACSALGFEVGEVWITANEIVKHENTDVQARDSIDVSDQKEFVDSSNTSRVDETPTVNPTSSPKRKRKIHFLQLYTSKNLNSILGHRYISNHNIYKEGIDHALSPLLVNAVADSSQIIWAHCQNVKDGLPKRTDILFQTAVGVPVAKDAEGNMFIVIMFSPNNISSNKEAVEYLQYIGTFATSTTIPCLLPVVKDRSNTFQLTYNNSETSISPTTGRWITNTGLPNSSISSNLMRVDMGSGISAQLIPYDYKTGQDLLTSQVHHDEMSQTNNLLNNTPLLVSNNIVESYSPPHDDLQTLVENIDTDVFDDASYGLWSTIMNASSTSNDITQTLKNNHQKSMLHLSDSSSALVKSHLNSSSTAMVNSSVIPTVILEAQNLSSIRKDRLEEFASAFLGLSVFDAADIWVCVSRNGGVVEGLTHSFSVLVTQANEGLNYFEKASAGCIVTPWNGAVGRAFWSGNAVWSSNKDIIVETPRAEAYDVAEITTSLAVPIFSDGAVMPSCVMCFYSLLRVDSVPFVLRFIQQALRLLWMGLDNIEPDESISKDLWGNVAPTDIGEMAADIEMQSAFVSRKKRRTGQTSIAEHRNFLRLPNADNEMSDMGETTQEMRKSNGSNGTIGTLDNSKRTNDENTAAALAFLKSLNDMILSSPLQGNGSSIAHKQFDLIKSSVHSVNHLQPETTTTLKQSSSFTAHDMQLAQEIPTHLNIIETDSLHLYPSKSINISRPIYETETLATSDTSRLSFDERNELGQPPLTSMSTVDDVSALAELLKNEITIDESKDAKNINSSTYDHNVSLHIKGNQSQDVHQIRQIESTTISSINRVKSSFSEYNQLGSPISSSSLNPDAPTLDSTQNTYPTDINLVKSANPLSYFYQLQDMKPDYNSDVVPYCVPTSATFDPNVDNIMQSSIFNKNHSNKVCEWPGCNKFPQGPTKYCISHGGGHRCQYPGCIKGARDKKWCTAHGGGKRCEVEGCIKAAVGSSSLCTAHGGGRRCSVNGCFKAAQSPTLFCVKHGGGKKCAFEGCDKVARGKTPYCAKHGGGIRCKIDGCTRVAIGKFQLCRAHGGKSQRAD